MKPSEIDPISHESRVLLFKLLASIGEDVNDFHGADISITRHLTGPDALKLTVWVDSFEPRIPDHILRGEE